MSEAPKRPNTALMRSAAEGHRTLSRLYALDPTPDADVTAQGSLMTALLLEAAAEFIDAVPQSEPEKVACDAPV